MRFFLPTLLLIMGSLVMLSAACGQAGNENAADSVEFVAAAVSADWAEQTCTHRRRLNEFRLSQRIVDSRERLDELLLVYAPDHSQVVAARASIDELEDQRDSVAMSDLSDCVERVRSEQVQREQQQQNFVPQGVTPNEWARMQAAVRQKYGSFEVLSAQLWPIPGDGCPGLDESAPVPDQEPWLGADDELPPCSLVLSILDWDAIIAVRFVREGGAWVSDDL